VFIAHLHFIVPFSDERQDLRIGETMRALKTMAKKWNIVISLIAHLKKTRLDTVPEDLRATRTLEPDRLLSKGDQGVGRRERLR